MPNLMKKRPDKDLEEGKLAHQKENKHQKTTKDPRDKRDNSVDSRGEVEVCRPQRPWAPRLLSAGPPTASPSSLGHRFHLGHKTA